MKKSVSQAILSKIASSILAAAICLLVQSDFLWADNGGTYNLQASDTNGNLPITSVTSGANMANYIYLSVPDKVSFSVNPHDNSDSNVPTINKWNLGPISTTNISPTPATGSGPIQVNFHSTTPNVQIPVIISSQRHKTGSGGGLCKTTGTVVTVVPMQIEKAMAPASGGAETFNALTDTTKKVLPGQKIILKLVKPDGVTIDSYQWTRPGGAFYDYTANCFVETFS